ncbi:MAG: hypothetical protein JWM21_1423 [Acidobacteria bacterium]|nr:hypothetical protein [Acidobacteriota bacterium]
MRFRRSLYALSLIVVLLFTSQPSLACGPFSLEAVFTFAVHPEFPLEKFAAGEIGVLQPKLARSYLFAAYRNLAGNAFTAREQKELLALWTERLDYTWPDFEESWPKPWLTARQKVAGVGAAQQVSVYRHREKPNEYETYINCQGDAFVTAASTLAERTGKFGADSTAVKDWVAAQDAVFANCSEGQHLPTAAPADADPVIRADRAYQIAAANFYAGSFDEAQKLFDNIARDANSPWRQTAAYLSARVLVRKASLGVPEKRSESLAQAEGALKKILSEGGFAKMHPASTKLLGLVRLRLHPDLRLRELAQALMKKDDETLKQDLWDYTILLDDFVGGEESDQTSDQKAFPDALRKDDLTDWIVTVEGGDEAALNHALERWHATSSTPWLIAALAKVSASHPQAGALLASAEKIDPGSPAFASASFHQIRLATESGRLDQARAKLDDLLAKHRAKLPVAAVNLFLGERMRLSTSLGEVLKYAQRQPAGFSWDEDNRQMPADVSEDADLKPLVGQTLFDADGAQLLNEKLPLSVLQQAAVSKVLPEYLRRDVVQATWLRAVLLDDSRVAKELTPALKTLFPAAATLLDDYLATQPEDARKFSALYAWLKLPGLQPMVHSGIGRRSALETQDSFRDNWWCAATLASSTGDDQGNEEKAKPAAGETAEQSPAFLSGTEKTAADNQRARLLALGAAPNFLCRQIIAWVEKHPADPRAPEALHLAVKTTRYGCTDKETRTWSKAAYDVLHKRFPNNPWTKKTPYWFKD